MPQGGSSWAADPALLGAPAPLAREEAGKGAVPKSPKDRWQTSIGPWGTADAAGGRTAAPSPPKSPRSRRPAQKAGRCEDCTRAASRTAPARAEQGGVG